MMLPCLIALCILCMYIWQDGIHSCPDTARYTASLTPKPFHRRYHPWNAWVLIATTYLSLCAIPFIQGWSISQTILFITLPGCWFLATHPATPESLALILALLSGKCWLMGHHTVAVCLSVLSGIVHERGPVFAAVYAWNWIPLIGLVGVQWWRKAGSKDEDPYVGVPLSQVLSVCKKHHDWLSWRQWTETLKLVLPLWVMNPTVTGGVALLLANLSRFVGTDPARFMIWAAPVLINELGPDISPLWLFISLIWHPRVV